MSEDKVIIAVENKGVGQMEYANVLLSAYRNLPQAIKAIKKNYFLRCGNSKYFYTPTDVFASDLLEVRSYVFEIFRGRKATFAF